MCGVLEQTVSSITVHSGFLGSWAAFRVHRPSAVLPPAVRGVSGSPLPLSTAHWLWASLLLVSLPPQCLAASVLSPGATGMPAIISPLGLGRSLQTSEQAGDCSRQHRLLDPLSGQSPGGWRAAWLAFLGRHLGVPRACPPVTVWHPAHSVPAVLGTRSVVPSEPTRHHALARELPPPHSLPAFSPHALLPPLKAPRDRPHCSKLDVILLVVITLLCFCFRARACRMPFFSYCAPFSVFGSSSSYFQSACVSQALGSCWCIKEWWLHCHSVPVACDPGLLFCQEESVGGGDEPAEEAYSGRSPVPRPVEELGVHWGCFSLLLRVRGWGGGPYQPSKVDAEFHVYAHFLWRMSDFKCLTLKIRN